MIHREVILTGEQRNDIGRFFSIRKRNLPICIVSFLFALFPSFIYATTAPISSSTTLSGIVVSWQDQSPLVGVLITITNVSTKETNTTRSDQSGHYSFDNLSSGAWDISIAKDDASTDLITSGDAVRALQAAVGILTLSPEQTLAADVNGDGKVNSVDAMLILQRKVEVFPRFSKGMKCGTDWMFFPSLLGVQNTSCQTTLITLSASPITQDFFGVKLGDIPTKAQRVSRSELGGGAAASCNFSFAGIYDNPSANNGRQILSALDNGCQDTTRSWANKGGLQISFFPAKNGIPACNYDRAAFKNIFQIRSNINVNDPTLYGAESNISYYGGTPSVADSVLMTSQFAKTVFPSDGFGNAVGQVVGSYPGNGARLCACANYLNLGYTGASQPTCFNSAALGKPLATPNLRITYDSGADVYHVHWGLLPNHRTLNQEFRIGSVKSGQPSQLLYSRTFSYYDDPQKKNFDFDISSSELGNLNDSEASIQAIVHASNSVGSVNSEPVVLSSPSPEEKEALSAPILNQVRYNDEETENSKYSFSWSISGSHTSMPNRFLLELAKDDNSFSGNSIFYQHTFAFTAPGGYNVSVPIAEMNLPVGAKHTIFVRMSSIRGDDVNNIKKASSNIQTLPPIPFHCEKPALGTGTTQVGTVLTEVPTCYDSRSDQYGLVNIMNGSGSPISTQRKENGFVNFLSKDNIWGKQSASTQSSPADLTSFAFEAHRNLGLVQQAIKNSFNISRNHPAPIRPDIEQHNFECRNDAPIQLFIEGDAEDIEAGPYADKLGIHLPYIIELLKPIQYRPDINTIGHEYGHGLYGCYTQNTFGKGNLENDALDEAFADLLGTFSEAQIDRTIKFISYFKLLGSEIEELVIRNLANPEQMKVFSHPSTYKGQSYLDLDPHINAGIPNKAFYLMIDGGTHNGITVESMSLHTIQESLFKVTKIAIAAAQNYWTKDTVIRDGNAGLGMVSAARTLFGKDSREMKTVADAWTAVLKYPECQNIDDVNMKTKLALRANQRVAYESSGNITFTPPPGFNFDSFANNFRISLPTVTVDGKEDTIVFDTSRGGFNSTKLSSGNYSISQSTARFNMNLKISQDTSFKQVKVSYKKIRTSNISGSLFPTFGLQIFLPVAATVRSSALGNTGNTCQFLPHDRCDVSANGEEINCRVKTRLPARSPSHARSIAHSLSDEPDFGPEPDMPVSN